MYLGPIVEMNALRVKYNDLKPLLATILHELTEGHV